MGNRKVITECPFCLNAEDPVKVQPLGHRSMEVFCLSCLFAKAPVIDRQILSQKLIGLSDAAYTPESHLLDQPVLKGIKEPLNSSFCLR